jgi:hypothetical protein
MIQLITLLALIVLIPQVKPLWRLMDTYAFSRPTLVKIYTIVMAFIAASRFYWYLATAILGQPDPTGPFVLHLGVLPSSMAEFPFTFILPQTAMTFQLWFLGMFIGAVSLIYGAVGLPKEGINRAVAIPNRIRAPMFFFGFHILWTFTALPVLPF